MVYPQVTEQVNSRVKERERESERDWWGVRWGERDKREKMMEIKLLAHRRLMDACSLLSLPTSFLAAHILIHLVTITRFVHLFIFVQHLLSLTV